MERGYTLTLNEQRKSDMSVVLNFFLWLTRRSDVNLTEYETQLKILIDLMYRLKHLEVGSKLQINLAEFLLLNTSAQYMLKAMSRPAGDDYLSDMLGDIKAQEWVDKQKKYFISICQYMIKECDSRFNDLPDFARERMRLEEQLQPF